MKNLPAPTTVPQGQKLVVSSNDPITGLLWDTAKFEHMQRVASMFANSGMVPDMFKKNPAACAVGLQLAAQLQVSPFMLFQKMYVIGGRPAIEAQLAIAVANQRDVFTAPIEYVFTGENKDRTRSCTAKATLTKSKKEVSMTVDWELVQSEGWDKKSGSKWKTMPDQMFRYRSALWLIRTYVPEVLFGMYSKEELDDMQVIDITPKKTQADPLAAALRGESDVQMGSEPENPPQETETMVEPEKPDSVVDSEAETAENGSNDNKTLETVKEFNKEAAYAKIDELTRKAGLNVESKKASLEVLTKTATGGKDESEWGEGEFRTLENTLLSIIEKNAKLAKIKEAQKKKGN